MSFAVRNRRQAEWDLAKKAYFRMYSILNGNFYPGYYNDPRILEEEENGLNLAQGMLWHTINKRVESGLSARASQLVKRVAAAVPTTEKSRCHNLAAGLFLALDSIGYPSVPIHGLLNAQFANVPAFVLNPLAPNTSEEVRPGHSWLLTPDSRVLDLSLCHQVGIGDRYEQIRHLIPPIVEISAVESKDPPPELWEDLPCGGYTISTSKFISATKLLNVTGWSSSVFQGLKLQYVPGAVRIPKEDEDLNSVNISFGGLRFGDFLASS